MGFQLGFRSHKAKALPAIAGPCLLFGLLLLVACASKSPTDPTAPGSTNTATNAAVANSTNTNATNTNTAAPYLGFPIETQGTWTNNSAVSPLWLGTNIIGYMYVSYLTTLSKSNGSIRDLVYTGSNSNGVAFAISGTNMVNDFTYVTNSGSNWVGVFTSLAGSTGVYTFDGTGPRTTGVGSNYTAFSYTKPDALSLAWSGAYAWGTLASRLAATNLVYATNFRQ